MTGEFTDNHHRLISDHALLRFMERVIGLDRVEFEGLMRERLDRAHDLGDGWLRDWEGMHYLVGDRGSIITVLTRDQGRNARRHPEQRKHY